MKAYKAYYVQYKMHSADKVHEIQSPAENEVDAYEKAVYSLIPEKEGCIPYSAWVRIMNSFEVYENCCGEILLFLFDCDGVQKVFEAWECGMKGCLLEAIGELAKDPDVWESWTGDLMEVLTEKYVVDEYDAHTGEIIRGHYEPYTIEGVYQTAKKDERYTSLIAEGEFGKFTVYLEKMGDDGKFVFGLE